MIIRPFEYHGNLLVLEAVIPAPVFLLDGLIFNKHILEQLQPLLHFGIAGVEDGISVFHLDQVGAVRD